MQFLQKCTRYACKNIIQDAIELTNHERCATPVGKYVDTLQLALIM